MFEMTVIDRIAEDFELGEPRCCEMCGREMPAGRSGEFCSDRCEVECEMQVDMLLEEHYLDLHQERR